MLRTSCPCAVTTSGARREERGGEPGRDEEVRVDDVRPEAPRRPRRSRARAQVPALARRRGRERRPARSRARARRARARSPGRRRRGPGRPAPGTSARRAGSSSAERATRAGRRTCRTRLAARCRSRRSCSGPAAPRASAAAGSRRPRRRGAPRRALRGLVRVPLGPHPRRALELPPLRVRVEPVQLDRLRLLLAVAVDADDHALARLDLGRVLERRLLDLPLDEALLDRRDRAAELVHPLDQLAGAPPRARPSAPR